MGKEDGVREIATGIRIKIQIRRKELGKGTGKIG